jgi:CheY-like chemotaxis protein
MFDLQNQYKNYRSNRILVVDDEEFCLTSMKALLLKFGISIDYQVDYCITGLEAVTLIKEMSQKGIFYKLILTDFCMPVMDGIQSSKKIRAYVKNNGYE